MRRALIGFGLALMMSGAAVAETPAANDQRIEAPIKVVGLPDGTLRFSVDITVGGQPVEAMLDTGSSGLRLLPGAVPASAVALNGRPTAGTYGSGVRLKGEGGRAFVGFGPASVDVPVEVVQKIECVEERPQCPAAKLSPDQFRIGGDGLVGQGFVAILGVGMRPADTPNPLAHLGQRRWIVELPRPGEGKPGRLILNPTPEESTGFASFRLPEGARNDAIGGPTWRDNVLPGCVVDLDSQARDCAPTMLDSGAPNFTFKRKEEPKPPWPAGVHAALSFKFDGGTEIQDRFTVAASPGTRVRYGKPTTDHFAEGLNAGFQPFLAFTVLYDMKAGVIGIKPR